MGSRIGPERRSVRGVGTALMVIVALVSALSAGPAAAQSDPEGILPDGEWTEEQANTLRDMVAEAEQKLPQFADSSTLADLGFVDIGPVAPGGWSHYVNVDWINDGGENILNPDYPESLVYRRGAGGEEELVAAMYFLPPEYSLDNIPEDIAWMPGWHDHPELCSNAQGQVVGFITPGSDDCPPDSTADGPPMMHVWIVDNECGHRFGGVGVGGLHCDYEHGGGEHDMDHDSGGEHDMDHDSGGEHDMDHDDGEGAAENGGVALPAPAIGGQPDFTG